MADSSGSSPIVFIHGIKGSHLIQTYDDSFDTIWSAVQKGFESIHDLALDDTGQVEADPFDVIAVAQLEKAAYGELLSRLRNRFEGVPIYIFRYDWRRDLADTAKELHWFLERVRRKTGASSFRFVTHSMGGLVLAAYLKRAKANIRRVERACLAAPPFWGAVEAMRGLVAGEASLLGIHSSDAFRKIGRTFPSVYQLVASYPGHWSHPLATASVWNIRHWQHRVDMGTRDPALYAARDARMQGHLKTARGFHKSGMVDFDALPETDRKKFLLLYGVGERTRCKIRVKKHNSSKEIKFFFDFESKPVFGDGDGTVPSVSATRFSNIPTIAVPLSDFSAWWPTLWDDKAKLRVAGFHAMFLGLDKVQGLVIDWLLGRDPKPSWIEPIKP